MIYLVMWVIMSAVLTAAGIGLTWYEGYDVSPVLVAGISMAVAAICIANDLKRPQPKEYYRDKALYPQIPDKYLYEEPISESIVFGQDYHTGKFVMAEPGHHCLICGSTGSGKTATSLIPSILSCKSGSKQIVDIKSRELAYKTADLANPKTIVVDMNLNASYC